MKKILLSALIAASFVSVKAQCDLGFTSTGVFDDYKSMTSYGDENGGLYYWEPVTVAAADSFLVSYTRDSANMEIDYVVTQKSKEYTPTGISFGDSNGDGTGVPVLIDLTDNAQFSVTVRNDGPEDIKFRIGLQDVNGNDADTKKGASLTAPWESTIEIAIASGATEVFTGDFDGATKATYINGTPDELLPYAQDSVKAITFTFVNATVDGDYAPLALIDQKVSISDLKLGACTVGLENAKLSKSGVSIYPNPAVSTLNISEELENVSVFNAQGIEVLTATKATQLNVETLESGVYVLKSDKGTSTFVVK